MITQPKVPVLLVPAPTWGVWAWSSFLAAVVLVFSGTELYAVAEGGYNTLSEFSWWQLGVYPGEALFAHGAMWWVSLAVCVAIMALLVWHIWWAGP